MTVPNSSTVWSRLCEGLSPADMVRATVARTVMTESAWAWKSRRAVTSILGAGSAAATDEKEPRTRRAAKARGRERMVIYLVDSKAAQSGSNSR